jgi:hypothetical protein
MPIGDLHTESDLLAFVDQNRHPVVSPLAGIIGFVDSAPTTAPKNGLGIRLAKTPGVGASMWVWDGTNWVAVA